MVNDKMTKIQEHINKILENAKVMFKELNTTPYTQSVLFSKIDLLDKIYKEYISNKKHIDKCFIDMKTGEVFYVARANIFSPRGGNYGLVFEIVSTNSINDEIYDNPFNDYERDNTFPFEYRGYTHFINVEKIITSFKIKKEFAIKCFQEYIELLNEFKKEKAQLDNIYEEKNINLNKKFLETERKA